jgi:hypothetical protein
MNHLANTLYLLDRPWMDRAATDEEEAEYAEHDEAAAEWERLELVAGAALGEEYETWLDQMAALLPERVQLW